MEISKVLSELKSLAALDMSAVRGYNQAIEKIDDLEIRRELMIFRDDHQRHVSELSGIIKTLGGEPPTAPVEGALIEGFTALRSITGTKGALEAMHTNEKLTNRRYADASAYDFPPEIKNIVLKNYEDEKHHLAYIESALELTAVSR